MTMKRLSFIRFRLFHRIPWLSRLYCARQSFCCSDTQILNFMNTLRIFITVLIFLAFHSHSSIADPNYDSSFDSYVKVCATSEPSALWKFTKRARSPGHSVMYMKGVCQDRHEDRFPKLRFCNS